MYVSTAIKGKNKEGEKKPSSRTAVCQDGSPEDEFRI